MNSTRLRGDPRNNHEELANAHARIALTRGRLHPHLWMSSTVTKALLEQTPVPDKWTEIRKGWDAFMQLLELDTPPLLTDGDMVERLDPEWQQTAERFLTAKRTVDGAAPELEAAKKALTCLAAHPSERGAGVCVSRYWKAGSVDYKQIPQLAGVDLESFGGSGREEVRVTALN